MPESGTADLLFAGVRNTGSITSDAFPVTAGITYTLSYWQTVCADYIGPESLFALITASAGTLAGTIGNMDSIAGSGTGAITWASGGLTAIYPWVNFTATFVPGERDRHAGLLQRGRDWSWPLLRVGIKTTRA